MMSKLMALATLIAITSAFPSHYHSCTFNFTGGERLRFPFCNTSLSADVRVADLLSRCA